MRKTLGNFALTLAIVLASLPAMAKDYVQAPGSRLVFAGTYQGEVFTGRFPGFATKLSFDPANLASSRLDVLIPMTTATTDNADYDGELLGSAFFDTKRFAQARYTATTFRKLDDGRFAADGTLTLHGISKPVTFTFSWAPGAKPVLTGRATVKRLDFGVGDGEWADTDLLPDTIAVSTRVILKPAP